MSFRNIRPSSTNAPNLSTSDGTGSDAAKKTPNESSSSSASKRRRVPESVTRNACANCKKARAKCDGKKPCSRCSTRMETSQCVYEIHIKHAKEELVKQIKELETKDQMAQQIFRALSVDQHVPEILQRLRHGETYDSIVEWLGPTDSFDVHSPAGSQHSILEHSDQEMSETSAFHWTTVTSDSSILDHLFQLYFAWIHPVHTLLDEGHFVNSFRNKSQLYCSPVLVNAMCALACHLHSNADTEEIEQLGLGFSEAVRSNINPNDRKLTTVQAFAVMFLVDCARGRCLRAASYLKVAASILTHVKLVEDAGFSKVLWNTTRGICSLNVEWAQLTFQAPVAIKSNLVETTEETDNELDEAQWYFYRYVDDQCPAWSGFLATTNREKAKLTAIIHDVTTMLYSPSGAQIQARQILRQYTRYLSWHKSLPKHIGDIENNSSQALPHVLSLLILYSCSVVQLLRPLLEMENLPCDGIDEVIWKHAQTGIILLDQHYRTQYTCRYQPVLQMFSLLHFCEVIVQFFPGKIDAVTKGGSEAVLFGLEVLRQSRQGFPIAGAFQELLRCTAIECSVQLPMNLIDLVAPARLPMPIYNVDDFIDACTRHSYIQPVTDILTLFDQNFSSDWIAQSPYHGFKDASRAKSLRRSDTEERAAENLMQISSLLNT